MKMSLEVEIVDDILRQESALMSLVVELGISYFRWKRFKSKPQNIWQQIQTRNQAISSLGALLNQNSVFRRGNHFTSHGSKFLRHLLPTSTHNK